MIVRLYTMDDQSRVEQILLENGMNALLAERQYVAEMDGQIVGTGGIWAMDRWGNDTGGWLASVAVAKSHKRAGIGRAIVTENLEHAAASGYEAVWLETYFWNTRFYESLGFRGVAPSSVPTPIKEWRVNKHCRFMCHRTSAS